MQPESAHASFLTGLAARRAGDLAGAAREFTQALAWHPTPQVRAACLLAPFASNPIETESPQAVAPDSAAPDPSLALGYELGNQGRFAEAAEVFFAAASRSPSSGTAWFFLASAWMDLGRFAEAAEAAHRSCLLEPVFDRIMLFGRLLARLGRLEEAEQAFAEARRLNPSDGNAAYHLGHLLRLRRKAREAIPEFEAALRLAPGDGRAHAELGVIHLAHFGDPEAAEVALERGVACGGAPEAVCRSRLLMVRHYRGRTSPQAMRAQHVAWDGRHAQVPWLAGGVDPDHAGRRLRVGYLSGDFKAHPVASFWDALGRHHDRSRFEIFCYADVAKPDAKTHRILALAEHGMSVAGMPDEVLARRIHADRLDLLVDLGGHAGERMGVFARKPAPIQATYLGYPDTTGLRAMDFRVVDALTDPPGEADAHCTEQLVRLPGCFLCYTPEPDAPAVVPPPCTMNGCVTFVSFNQFAKLTAEWAAWVAAVLRAVPKSRLMLKSFGLAADVAQRHAVALFDRQNIGAERLRVLAADPDARAHLARYGEADIALDAFPYHGTTTTCEALWMGVPVVSLAGPAHVSRVGASLLTHMGLSEWVAANPEDYVKIAVDLANQPEKLRAWRQTMRSRMQPLTDGEAFARKLEDAYFQMARGYADSATQHTSNK